MRTIRRLQAESPSRLGGMAEFSTPNTERPTSNAEVLPGHAGQAITPSLRCSTFDVGCSAFILRAVRFFLRHARRSALLLVAAVLLPALLTGCSPYKTRVKRNPGIEMPGQRRFRINYDIHDPDGKSITDEIMQDDIDRWILFAEMCDRAKVAFEELGYEHVYDPGAPADFVVDVGFSSFYSDTITDKQLWNQQPATLLVGGRKGDMFVHLVTLSALSHDPALSSDDYVVLWDGRGTCVDESDDIRYVAFPIMVELLEDFPEAD